MLWVLLMPHILDNAQMRQPTCERRHTSQFLLVSAHLPGACTVTGEATHCLGAIHDALKQEGGRLSVILRHQAAVGCDWGELVRKDPLIERDWIAVPCCFAEAGEL